MSESVQVEGVSAGGAVERAGGAQGCCAAAPAAVKEPVAAQSPCCGTSAQAEAEGSCCGSAAKSEAVAAGAGCCG